MFNLRKLRHSNIMKPVMSYQAKLVGMKFQWWLDANASFIIQITTMDQPNLPSYMWTFLMLLALFCKIRGTWNSDFPVLLSRLIKFHLLRYWHGQHSMPSRVYAPARRPSITPFVCPTAGDIDRLLHSAQQCSTWQVNRGSVTIHSRAHPHHLLYE